MAELEGFICPYCKKDLKGIAQLEEHFKDEHEEKRFTKFKASIKTMFDKAKPKLTKKRELSVDEGAAAGAAYSAFFDPAAIISGIDPALWPPQEPGAMIDHLRGFRKIRDAKLAREAVESNRLVIRLEKLFRLLKQERPRTSKELKEIEKELVPWKPDRSEKRCMKCGRSFGVQRRKHHCRLCGDIICEVCSLFVSLSEIYPLLMDCPDYTALTPSYKLPKKLSVLDEDEEGLRMCHTCSELLSRRLQRLASEVKPLLAAYYEKMQLTMDEADSLKPQYLEIIESLMKGEYLHTLVEAQRRRGTLIKLYESIDAVSKQILAMGTSPTPEAPPLENPRLCRGIRIRASQYLQENLLGLPAPPTSENLQALRAAKEREAQERVKEMMRQREIQQQQQEAAKGGAGVDSHAFRPGSKNMPSRSLSSIDRTEGVGVGTGWVGTVVSRDSLDSEDPFVVQRKQLLSFIQQAKQSGHLDEMEALQASLAEIDQIMEQGRRGPSR